MARIVSSSSTCEFKVSVKGLIFLSNFPGHMVISPRKVRSCNTASESSCGADCSIVYKKEK